MARTALLNVMVKAVLKAGRGLARDFGEVENLQVSLKGPGDFVSAADHRADETLVKELKQRDIGVLITDHNVRETLDIVDRACIIYDGQVLFAGTPDALVADQEVRRLYLGESFAL